MVVSALRKLDPLSSKKTRIQRTAAGSEQCECGAHRRELDVPPGLGRMHEGKAHLRDSDQRARDRRPQTNQQQECTSSDHHFKDHRGRQRRQQTRLNQRKCGCRAEQEQAGSGQSARKGRVEPLHT
jgi:hypothetical protein